MGRTYGMLVSAALVLAGCAHNYERWLPATAPRSLAVATPESGPARVMVEDFRRAWEAEVTNQDGDEREAHWLAAIKYHLFRIKASPDAVPPQSGAVLPATHAWHNVVAPLNDAKLNAFYGEEFAAIRDANRGKAPAGAIENHHCRIGLALSGGGLRVRGSRDVIVPAVNAVKKRYTATQ